MSNSTPDPVSWSRTTSLKRTTEVLVLLFLLTAPTFATISVAQRPKLTTRYDTLIQPVSRIQICRQFPQLLKGSRLTKKQLVRINQSILIALDTITAHAARARTYDSKFPEVDKPDTTAIDYVRLDSSELNISISLTRCYRRHVIISYSAASYYVSGQARFTSEDGALNIDIESGREILITDLVDIDSNGLVRLFSYCEDLLHREAKRQAPEIEDADPDGYDVSLVSDFDWSALSSDEIIRILSSRIQLKESGMVIVSCLRTAFAPDAKLRIPYRTLGRYGRLKMKRLRYYLDGY